VELGLVESTRIAVTLSVPPELVFTAVPHQPDPSGLGTQPAFDLDTGPSLLALRRREDSLACPFKLDLQGFGRCGIYALRPGACRLYPYHLEDPRTAEQLRFGTTDYCATRWLHDERTAVVLERELRRWRADIALDEELAAEWNGSARVDRSVPSLFSWAKVRLASVLGS
jgi:Fe-S-cluster containining protein